MPLDSGRAQMILSLYFLWYCNDNLKRFLYLFDNDDVSIPAGKLEHGDLCLLIPKLLSQRREMNRL